MSQAILSLAGSASPDPKSSPSRDRLPAARLIARRWPSAILAVVVTFFLWPAWSLGGGSVAVAEMAAQPAPIHIADAPSGTAAAQSLRDLLAAEASPVRDIGQPAFAMLARFYASRADRPLWLGPDGLAPVGGALLERLREIAADGEPSIAPLVRAAEARLPAALPDELAKLELLLSAGLAETGVDPRDPASEADASTILARAATAADPLTFLRLYLPVDPAFWRLREAILAYGEIAARGGWPEVAEGGTLRLGDRDARTAQLRARLLAGADLLDPGSTPELFDAALEAAVRRFQTRHGLDSDGIVGKKTLAALNVPIARRIAAMELNLRRLQQEDREWGARYLAVNTAAATYRVVENGRQLFERPAIVGRPDWPTPSLDSVIDRLEFNPYWLVPPRIARLELWPKIRRDPGYLERNDMQLVNGQLRQRPGPKNPLGVVKFHFDNPSFIYLHDTNNRQRFDRPDRFLSHGCIRASGAVDLAALLLEGNRSWPRDRIDAVIAAGRNLEVALADPMPIHVVYDTAWVDASGAVQFRPDTYGRDGRWSAAAAESCSG